MSRLVCDFNCTECKFSDCIIDDDFVSLKEYHRSLSLDKDIKREETPKEVLKHREASLAYYHRNRDSYLKKKADYREENRERLREESKKYYKENQEQIKQRHLATYYSNHEENKKKNRDAKRNRYQANPEYYRQKQREYRQRRKEKQNASNKGQPTTSLLSHTGTEG